jgi:hypothetical protein
MKITEAIKSLTSISSKVTPKEQNDHGHIGFSSKKKNQFLYVNSSQLQCVVSLENNLFNVEDVDFKIDGKMLLKAMSECSSDDSSISVVNNSDGKPSAILIKSAEEKFEFSVPISDINDPVKLKKNSGKAYSVNKHCFIDLVKSTYFAGNDIDPERPYFYALFKINTNNVSCTCGNGTFFTYASCLSENACEEEVNFLIPISLLGNIMSIITSSSDSNIDIYINNNSVSFCAKEFKIHMAVDINATSWPNASAIFDRKSGNEIEVNSNELVSFASKLDIAIDSYSNKSETLKCKMSVKENELSFAVDSLCKIKYNIKIANNSDFVSDIFFDAACLSLTMKGKYLGEKFTINIDDSEFNGRSSPILMTTNKNGFIFKAFFAINI